MPARLVESNAGLIAHARSLVVAVVGIGADEGERKEEITLVAHACVACDWELGTHQRGGAIFIIYPRLLAAIRVLGGEPATQEFPATVGGRAGGSPGDPLVGAHVKQAARHLEAILVALFHVGGRAAVLPVASGELRGFGIESLVGDGIANLSLDRATYLFGTVLSRLHRAMHRVRTDFDPTLVPGVCPLDILSVVQHIRSEALSVAIRRQATDESVSERLTQLGWDPASLAKAQSSALEAALEGAKKAVGSAAQVAVDKAVKASRWGPPGGPPLGSQGGGGGGGRTLPPGAVDWLGPVRAFESASAPGCPWWCLFGDCKMARTEGCARCLSGVMCDQSLVNDIKATFKGTPVAEKIVGRPAAANTALQDGGGQDGKSSKRVKFVQGTN